MSLPTARQKQVLDFIVAYQAKNGISPSYDEIAAALNLTSIATVHKHIGMLERKGCLTRSHSEARSITVAPRYLKEQEHRQREIESLQLHHVKGTDPREAVA